MAAPKKKKAKGGKAVPKEITFHYIKTPNYRTYHVDGFYGGLTARGNLYAELFVERKPTPQEETYKIIDRNLGPKTDEKGKKGFIREIEAGIAMDYSTMLALKKWLDGQIAEYQLKYQAIKKH